MISERTAIDKIEILENGLILVRRARVILDADGTELNRLFQRVVLEPGQDVSLQPQKIRAICNLIWTAQVIADYQAARAAIPQLPVPLP